MTEKTRFSGQITTIPGTKVTFWYEELALFGFICTMPLEIRYNTPFIILLSFSWLRNRRYLVAYQTLRNNRIFYALVAFYVISALSIFYSENTSVGARTLETRLSFLFVPVLLSGFVITPRLMTGMMRAYILAMVGVSMLSIGSIFYHYGLNYDLSYFSFVLADFVGPSVNHYAIYILFALLFLIISMIEQPVFPKVWSIVILMYLIVFLGLLSSRMALILFVVLSTFLLVRTMFRVTSRSAKLKAAIAALAIIGFTTILIASVPYLRDRVTQMTKGFSDDPRYKIVQASVQLIKEEPLLGYGVGDVQDHLNDRYQAIGFTEGFENTYNPHNDWLNAWLSAGIPCVLSLLAIYVFCVQSMIRQPDVYKFLFIAVYLLSSQTEAIFNRNKGVLLFTFMISLAFIMQVSKTERGEQHV